jgi:hypothetical protein
MGLTSHGRSWSSRRRSSGNGHSSESEEQRAERSKRMFAEWDERIAKMPKTGKWDGWEIFVGLFVILFIIGLLVHFFDLGK